jgi:acetamidase/formamidase
MEEPANNITVSIKFIKGSKLKNPVTVHKKNVMMKPKERTEKGKQSFMDA